MNAARSHTEGQGGGAEPSAWFLSTQSEIAGELLLYLLLAQIALVHVSAAQIMVLDCQLMPASCLSCQLATVKVLLTLNRLPESPESALYSYALKA